MGEERNQNESCTCQPYTLNHLSYDAFPNHPSLHPKTACLFCHLCADAFIIALSLCIFIILGPTSLLAYKPVGSTKAGIVVIFFPSLLTYKLGIIAPFPSKMNN